MNRYIIIFTGEFEEFQLPELISLCEMLDLSPRQHLYYKPSRILTYAILFATAAQVEFIAERVCLIQGIYELWGQGHTVEQACHQAAQHTLSRSSHFQHTNNPFQASRSFSIDLLAWDIKKHHYSRSNSVLKNKTIRSKYLRATFVLPFHSEASIAGSRCVYTDKYISVDPFLIISR